MANANGWEQLVCPYFYEVCVEELGFLFRRAGFMPARTDSNNTVFAKDDVYVEIGYVPETAPRYAPSVVIGFGKSKYDEDGGPTCVPAWRIVPDDAPEGSYSAWRFSDEESLKQVLKRIYAEVVSPYLEPLWQDRARLTQLIDQFRREL